MSLERTGVSVGLGDLSPRGSRQQWRRSSVAALEDGERADGGFAVGTADGTVRVLDGDGSERWRAPGDEMAVALAEVGGGIAVGSRGDRGRIRLLAGDSNEGDDGDEGGDAGEELWHYDTADDLGGPAKETLFWYPYVVDLVGGEEHLYAAARRYERHGDERVWQSAVYAFDADGEVCWKYETDASPIALSLGGGRSSDEDSVGYGRSSDGNSAVDRLAVAYNRCGGDHDHGLVVLDAPTGDPLADWDPGTEGERRVGDVSLSGEAVAAASHGDYRGYLLGSDGEERWRTDLGVELAVGDETLYAYPNHVHLAEDVALFVTGNTFPVEGREAEGRHPNEHTITAVARAEGDRLWSAPVGGFVSELAASEGRLAVPCAQHFRDRTPDAHGLRVFDAHEGLVREIEAEGIVTAAALDGDRLVFVEEPVEYHDEGETRGEYRLRVESV